MNITQIFKKNYIIGLDIGASSIKIAEFQKAEDGLHLVKADLREIRKVADEAAHEKEVLSTLKDLFSGINVKKSKIVASINCPMTAIKKVVVPYMPQSELKEAIKLELEHYFPFPIEGLLLDYKILRDIVEKGIRRYEVLVSVSPKMTVDKTLTLFGKVKIKPNAFVPSCYALQAPLGASYYAGDKTICFVEIGEKSTELVISKGGDLKFARKIPVAGADFTKAMTGALFSDMGRIELTLEEAEKIKQRVGIPSETQKDIIDGKFSHTQILSMLRTPLDSFVNEIERCFDYYREESGARIDLVVLFGGGASLTGLTDFLSKILSVEVRLGDSLEGLKVELGAVKEPEKISHRLKLAIGAALSVTKGVNILPPEIKDQTKRAFQRATIQAFTSAVILILIFMHMGIKIQINNFDKRISVATLELSSLEPQLEKAEAYHLANMVLVDEPHWEDIFKELSNSIPDQMRFTEIRMEDGVVTLKGTITLEDGEQVCSDCVLALEKGIFTKAKISKVEDLAEGPGSSFELKCWTK